MARIRPRPYPRTMMPDETPRDPGLGEKLWAVQPGWVKLLAGLVAFPAWLVMALCIFGGGSDQFLFKLALGLFVAIGAIELACIARAFWRMEL